MAYTYPITVTMTISRCKNSAYTDFTQTVYSGTYNGTGSLSDIEIHDSDIFLNGVAKDDAYRKFYNVYAIGKSTSICGFFLGFAFQSSFYYAKTYSITSCDAIISGPGNYSSWDNPLHSNRYKYSYSAVYTATTTITNSSSQTIIVTYGSTGSNPSSSIAPGASRKLTWSCSSSADHVITIAKNTPDGAPVTICDSANSTLLPASFGPAIPTVIKSPPNAIEVADGLRSTEENLLYGYSNVLIYGKADGFLYGGYSRYGVPRLPATFTWTWPTSGFTSGAYADPGIVASIAGNIVCNPHSQSHIIAYDLLATGGFPVTVKSGNVYTISTTMGSSGLSNQAGGTTTGRWISCSISITAFGKVWNSSTLQHLCPGSSQFNIAVDFSAKTITFK